MSATPDQLARPHVDEPDAMGKRLFRTMCWAVALGVAASPIFEPWRVTAGLALGGALALLNHRWLSASVRTVFSGASLAGVRPKLGAARFFLRYFV
ncbi:MAG: hypothetical protein LC746_06770, partial [Acidobacteria bacterium]|nr:hypothetical protein [Acidobacteriota bacterium]